ncbi:MAG: YitT family protein [Bacilli bacterium]|nr:YitT family protein [Bacilli bacterium]
MKLGLKNLRQKQKSWLYDHPFIKSVLDNAWVFIVSTISALCFAFGFNAFMDPGVKEVGGQTVAKLVAGGMSGVSQNIVLFFHLCGWNDFDEHLAYSIIYFGLNVPLIFLAWFGIGKRFAIFTLINVAEVSLFIKLITVQYIPGLETLATFINNNGGLLARALFAGVTTGLSSALAFKVDISAGGVDVISYYIALKKGVLAGKYNVILNSITVLVFTLFTSALANWESVSVAEAFGRVFYSALYLLTCMIMIDHINVRNKKVQVRVVTEVQSMGDILINFFPHGVTAERGTGVFSGHEKYIFTIVIANSELSKVIEVIRETDQSAFVEVMDLRKIYGRFHVKAIK